MIVWPRSRSAGWGAAVRHGRIAGRTGRGARWRGRQCGRCARAAARRGRRGDHGGRPRRERDRSVRCEIDPARDEAIRGRAGGVNREMERSAGGTADLARDRRRAEAEAGAAAERTARVHDERERRFAERLQLFDRRPRVEDRECRRGQRAVRSWREHADFGAVSVGVRCERERGAFRLAGDRPSAVEQMVELRGGCGNSERP